MCRVSTPFPVLSLPQIMVKGRCVCLAYAPHWRYLDAHPMDSLYSVPSVGAPFASQPIIS